VSDRVIRAGLRGGRVGGLGEGGGSSWEEESWRCSDAPGEGGTEVELGTSWTDEVEAKSDPRRGRSNFFVCFLSEWCDDDDDDAGAGASRIGEKPTMGVEPAAVNELD
jgi:hypothetical protein